MPTPQTIVLVDGSSFLFRAYHAMPPLTTAEDLPTGALYGVLNMLRKLIKDYTPDYLAVIFDPKGKNFRHELFPEYKANRDEMPEELREQIAPLHTIIEAQGLPLVIMDGVEADDVIGNYAKLAEQDDLRVIIATGDKDMAQLVTKQTSLVNTMSDTTLDEAGVKEKFGVPPERIIDYLTLIGDKVDNIPGVDKVGPKTAVKWLEAYGDLDGVVEHADAIKGKVGENLRATLPQLPLYKELVTIRTQLDAGYSLEALTPTMPDVNALKPLFKKYEFKSWFKELSSKDTDSATETAPTIAYETIFEQAQLTAWLDKLKATKQFSFDTETTSLSYHDAEIVGVSFAVAPGDAAYLPLGHDYLGAPMQLDRDEVLQLLKPLLEDPTYIKIGQNLKYDINVLANYGIHLKGGQFDTMLESYVLNSTASRHDMDSLANYYLDINPISFESIAGKGSKQLTFNDVPVQQASPYAAEDADITLKLHQRLWPNLKSFPKLKSVFETIEMPLMPILADMEYTGVLIDRDLLAKQSQVLGERLAVLQKETFSLADSEFNLNSPKQLQHILFEKMGLPILKKTPKGQPSTAEEVLQDLAHDYALPKLILEHRSLSKLKSTYTDSLPTKINPKTGRIHTSYHQATTSTGRLSSVEPNLQNIPIRTPAGRQIREAFIAAPGHQLVAADYSQIELRIMAHLSQDPGLLGAFGAGLDVHKATASEVFATPLDDVTSEQRRRAKAINFGLIYGMSAFGLARQLGIERQEAQTYMDCYFDRYPNVQAYMDKTRRQAHNDGYVETLFGRRLNLAEINSKNKMRVMAAERAAINGPMQGTAADLIKLAMIHAFDAIADQKLAMRMLMQVHDELIFEVPDREVEHAVPLIREKMMGVANLDVPLLVEIGIGANWEQAH